MAIRGNSCLLTITSVFYDSFLKERRSFVFTPEFFARYFTSVSIFFALWAAYSLVKQFFIQKTLFLKYLPKSTLRLAGIGLIFTFLAYWIKSM